MSTITSTTAETRPTTALTRKKWTIAEFDRLHEDGYLRDGSLTYLWDGEIIEPMVVNQPHVLAVANLIDAIKSRLPADSWTIVQDAPVVLREGYKPQPDLSVFRGPRSRFRQGTPLATDAALVAEVSSSSYGHDSGDFLRQYAAAGIPQYWIVNIPARRIEMYTSPMRTEDGTPGFATRMDYGLASSAPLSLVVDGMSVAFAAVPVIEVLRDSIEPAEGD